VILLMQGGTPAGEAAVESARAAARGGGVAVVLPLKVHGYAFGLPNPGLMPTTRERAAAEDAITETVRRLRRQGVGVDGEIVVTRHAAKAVDRVARRRSVQVVVVDQPVVSRLRRVVEGDICRQLTRRLPSSVAVKPVSG
jgi:hypothetical protein